MARILLNTRASRITAVDNILLLPAEVRTDEALGKVIQPSKTLISERPRPNGPSPYNRIQGCRQTCRLIQAGILRWSDEKVDEPIQVDEPPIGKLVPSSSAPDAPLAGDEDAATQPATKAPPATAPVDDGTAPGKPADDTPAKAAAPDAETKKSAKASALKGG